MTSRDIDSQGGDDGQQGRPTTIIRALFRLSDIDTGSAEECGPQSDTNILSLVGDPENDGCARVQWFGCLFSAGMLT